MSRHNGKRKVPAGSYVVLGFTPEQEQPSAWNFTTRAQGRHGLIAHFDREEWMPERVMRVHVLHPGGGTNETRNETYLVDIRKVCEAPRIELVEYPEGDVKALLALRARIDKSLQEARKGKVLRW